MEVKEYQRNEREDEQEGRNTTRYVGHRSHRRDEEKREFLEESS